MKVRRTLPLPSWPALDRELWIAAQGHGYAATLRPASLQRIIKSYGRWLAVWIAERGRIDVKSPADRVTPEAVQTYLARLRVAGNTRSTIEGRLEALVVALRIMAPRHNLAWLRPTRLCRDEPPRMRPLADAEHLFRDWPLLDRQLWEAAFQPADLLTAPRPPVRLRPATIEAFIVMYRRWLVFLRDQGRLDPAARPATRVTPENVTAYFKFLRRTNVNSSIVKEFSTLRSIMRIIEPEVDFRWLIAPGGRYLASWLPHSKKTIAVPDSRFLFEQGLAMMREALNEPHPGRRRIAYRNGLLIAIFAARAPRVRSMASLQLGKTVIQNGTTYRLIFEHEDVKTGRHIEFDAPSSLSAAINHYIAVERAEMLNGKTHDVFWINRYGDPLNIKHISGLVRWFSRRLFGKAFGPHRFRHALGTTAPLVDPKHPGVAAAVLGISPHMVERHYNRANQADVAQRFHNSLKKQRLEVERLARREFERQNRYNGK